MYSFSKYIFELGTGHKVQGRGGGWASKICSSGDSFFVDSPLNKGWPTPLHLAESGMTPPLVTVVISIGAICMLCNDMTVGHYRSYGTRTAAMSWIM